MEKIKPHSEETERRVAQMERAFEELESLVQVMEQYVDRSAAVAPQVAALAEYMESGQWQADYEADEQGLISAKLRRGVLSQDGLWNLLERFDAMKAAILETLEQNENQPLSH